MIVKLDLDPKLVWRLEEAAERDGVTMSDYAIQVLCGDRAVRQPHAKRVAAGVETQRKIAELHAQGLTDAEIADRVERVQGHVARLRRRLGLAPHRRKGTE